MGGLALAARIGVLPSLRRPESYGSGHLLGRISASGQYPIQFGSGDWITPRTLDHGCLICRLCDLSACPAGRCPVEQRYQQFAGQDSHTRSRITAATGEQAGQVGCQRQASAVVA
jgi:hypothetical protein